MNKQPPNVTQTKRVRPSLTEYTPLPPCGCLGTPPVWGFWEWFSFSLLDILHKVRYRLCDIGHIPHPRRYLHSTSNADPSPRGSVALLGIPHTLCLVGLTCFVRSSLHCWACEQVFGYLLYGGYCWGCFGVTDFTLGMCPLTVEPCNASSKVDA